MKIIKIPIFILLSIGLSATTIDELIDSGLANNSIIQKDKLQTQLIEEKRKESRAKKFGEFDMVGSYTHYNLPRTLAPIVPSALSPTSSVETTKDLFTTGIQYSVPLYTGGALSQQVEIDNLSKVMAETKSKLTREELIYNIRSLYLSGLSIQALINSQDSYIQALQKLKDIVQESVNIGKKARIDLIKSDTALQEAKGNRLKLESSLKMIKSTLMAITHIDNIDYLEPISVSVDKQINSIPEEEFENLERFKLQNLEIEKGDRVISKAKSIREPQVAVNSYMGYSYDIDDFSLSKERMWQVGVNLKWDIFDFDKTSAKIQQAKISKLQAIAQKQATTEGFKKLLAKATSDIETSFANYQTNLSNLNLLKETQKIEEARYEAGVATLNDLLLAKSKTQLAKSKLIESEYSYQNGVYYLDYLLERGEIQR